MIGQGIVLFIAIAWLALTLRICGIGDRGGVSWFDLPLVPLNRAERRRRKRR
jgi:hypothetical protein